MTLSIAQKIQIALINLAIKFLWLLDLFAYFFSRNTYLKVSKLALGILVIGLGGVLLYNSLISFDYAKKLSTFHSGINTVINGPAISLGTAALEGGRVLGTSRSLSAPPVLQEKSAFPYVSAKSHIIVDNNSGKILNEHNSNVTFAPASTTKLMTALVALDLYSMQDELSITSECSQIESTKLWLPVGSSYTVKNLIYSLLISSAADSGCALTTGKVSGEEFVELMNQKAAKIGMKNTHFTNSIGLDGENGTHYSSAWDLYLLSQKAMEDSMIREIVKTNLYSFTSEDDEDFKVNIENTNILLKEIPDTIGIKTGRTDGAGEVLIYRYNDGTKDLTIIVMSSENRFLDTRNLLDWTLESYSWGK